MTSSKQDIFKLQKVELHCHLIGIIGPEYIKMASNRCITFDVNRILELYPINNVSSFGDWLSITSSCQKMPLECSIELLRFHIEKLLMQNVVYSEIMISPLILPSKINDAIGVMRIIISRVKSYSRDNLQIKFLYTIPRSLVSWKFKLEYDKIISLYESKLIVGVAVVGLEKSHSIFEISPLLTKLKDKGVGIEIHSGEHGSINQFVEVLNSGLADRIGHGTVAFQRKKILDQAVKQNLHFEFCLTSNLKTGSVTDLSVHPIIIANEIGLSYSISTDDPGIFECSMNSEYEMIYDKLKFNSSDFNKILENSKKAAFSEIT